jgi:hypothetical protein
MTMARRSGCMRGAAAFLTAGARAAASSRCAGALTLDDDLIFWLTKDLCS